MFSWDEAAGDYDKNVTDWRSFITVISEVEDNRPCEGAGMKTMGEARMDIVNSEIGYLGYYASESYGLTWKVSFLSSQPIMVCVRCSGCHVGSPFRRFWSASDVQKRFSSFMLFAVLERYNDTSRSW